MDVTLDRRLQELKAGGVDCIPQLAEHDRRVMARDVEPREEVVAGAEHEEIAAEDQKPRQQQDPADQASDYHRLMPPARFGSPNSSMSLGRLLRSGGSASLRALPAPRTL